MISSASSAGLKCLCNYQVQCHKELRLIKGCILSLHLVNLMVKRCRVLFLSSDAVLPCHLPKVTGSCCPLPALPRPLASDPIIVRPEKILFHLANLMEKSGGEGGGEASFLLHQLTQPTLFAA